MRRRPSTIMCGLPKNLCLTVSLVSLLSLFSSVRLCPLLSSALLCLSSPAEAPPAHCPQPLGGGMFTQSARNAATLENGFVRMCRLWLRGSLRILQANARLPSDQALRGMPRARARAKTASRPPEAGDDNTRGKLCRACSYLSPHGRSLKPTCFGCVPSVAGDAH